MQYCTEKKNVYYLTLKDSHVNCKKINKVNSVWFVLTLCFTWTIDFILLEGFRMSKINAILGIDTITLW